MVIAALLTAVLPPLLAPDTSTVAPDVVNVLLAVDVSTKCATKFCLIAVAVFPTD